MPEKTLPATKIHYRGHFTIGTFSILLLKNGFRFVQIPSESVFLEIFFHKINFPLNSPLQQFEHHAKVKKWSKMVLKEFFLDLMIFLTHINIRPNEFLKSIFLCTTILYHTKHNNNQGEKENKDIEKIFFLYMLTFFFYIC